MILQDIYIERADWHVRVYHAVDAFWTDEILDDLIKIGCRGENLRNAKDNLWRGLPNQGLTFSNQALRRTVMVIGYTSGGAEYWNTLDHEKQHLLEHIASATGISEHGEEICYIAGEFMRDVYAKASSLLCDCCRDKIGAVSKF